MIDIITTATVPNIARPRTLTRPDILLVIVMDKKSAGRVGMAMTAKHRSVRLVVLKMDIVTNQENANAIPTGKGIFVTNVFQRMAATKGFVRMEMIVFVYVSGAERFVIKT